MKARLSATPGIARSGTAGSRRAVVIQTTAIVMLAAFVGFWGLGEANIGSDELIYQEAGVRYLQGDTSANPEHPPVAKYLLGLWQLVFGVGLTSARALLATVMVVTALVAFFWLRSAFDPVTALAGAAMLVTTHRVVGADFIDRQVLLDPFGIAFGIAGLALLWHWERTRRLPIAFLAGSLLGLAITSKASAATLLLGALACVPWRHIGRREVWSAVLAFGVAGVAACLMVYAPLGGVDAVATMVESQQRHAAEGHLIAVAGATYQHAPWFAVLWFGGETVGWLALISIVALAVVGVALTHRSRATRMIAAAGIASFIVLSASPVALPHYTWGWIWSPLLLSGIGIVALWRRARAVPARAVVGIAAALLLVGPVTGIAHVLSVAPTGVARIDQALADDPARDGTVLTLQLSTWITDPNVDAPVSTDPTAADITAVAIGQDLRFPADAELVDAIAREEPALTLDDVRLYILDDDLAALLARQLVEAP